MSYHVNEKGYYGEFGGAFIPEMLYPNVEELRQNYLKITLTLNFKLNLMPCSKNMWVVLHHFILQNAYQSNTILKST